MSPLSLSLALGLDPILFFCFCFFRIAAAADEKDRAKLDQARVDYCESYSIERKRTELRPTFPSLLLPFPSLSLSLSDSAKLWHHEARKGLWVVLILEKNLPFETMRVLLIK